MTTFLCPLMQVFINRVFPHKSLPFKSIILLPKNVEKLVFYKLSSATPRIICCRDAIKPTQSTGVQKQSRALWKRHRFFTNPKSIICQFTLLALGWEELQKMMQPQKIHSVNFKMSRNTPKKSSIWKYSKSFKDSLMKCTVC